MNMHCESMRRLGRCELDRLKAENERLRRELKEGKPCVELVEKIADAAMGTIVIPEQRDPRTDPRPGDVVRTQDYNSIHLVTQIDDRSVFSASASFCEDEEADSSNVWSIQTWRESVHDCTVLHVADVGGGDE